MRVPSKVIAEIVEIITKVMTPQKIAVIGAGAAGLTTLRQFITEGQGKYEVTCFERLSDIGGLWIYSDVIHDVNHPTGSEYTAVYKNLTTNIPIQIMAFTDFPFPSGLPSFVKHEVVKKYLQDYCDHFNLKRFIQFNKRVVNIKPMSVISHDDIWIIKVEDVYTKELTTQSFDVVIICNGHFSEPIYPKIRGIDKFKGTLLHSQTYRDPKDYENKRVLVIGGGPSGVDIASEICEFAEKIWISHRSDVPLALSNKIEQINEISYFDGSLAFYKDRKRANIELNKPHCADELCRTHQNNKTPEEYDQGIDQSSFKSIDNIDYIICCTGFSYSYPFLSCDCGVAVIGPFHVGPLYKDLISASRPNLAFIGLHSMIIPFPLSEAQAKFYKAILDGKVAFPKSSSELLVELRKDLEVKKAQGIDIYADPHKIGEWQWDYIKELALLGGFDPTPPYYQSLHAEVRKQRKLSLLDYKIKNYQISDDGSFKEIVK